MSKIIFIIFIIFSSTAVFCQPTINGLTKQIAQLGNRLNEAIKNGEKAIIINKMIGELDDLKLQLSALKNFQNQPKQTGIYRPCPPVWTGSLVMIETLEGKFMTREKHIDLTFNRNVQTSDLEGSKFNNIGSGTVKDHSNAFGSDCNCQGVGDATLTVVGINESRKIYWIAGEGPACKGGDNGGACGGDCYCVGVDDQPLIDKNFLTGTKTVTREITTEETAKITTIWNMKRFCPPWNDPDSDKKITTLKQKMIDPVYRFVKRVEDELCIKLRVTFGFRTPQKQDEIYAQGRTKPGPIVTNAKGGQSNHNFGLAIDVVMVNCDNTTAFNTKIPQDVARIANEEGLQWGGDWTKKGKNGKVFKDYPHFEMK